MRGPLAALVALTILTGCSSTVSSTDAPTTTSDPTTTIDPLIDARVAMGDMTDSIDAMIDGMDYDGRTAAERTAAYMEGCLDAQSIVRQAERVIDRSEDLPQAYLDRVDAYAVLADRCEDLADQLALLKPGAVDEFAALLDRWNAAGAF